MRNLLRTLTVCAILVAVTGLQAQVINTFDTAPADTNYWEWYDPVTEGGSADFAAHYAISTNADPTLGWIHTSYISDPVAEGTGAMQIDYSVHNSEGWGGYTKLHHFHPDSMSTGVYDWSLYDTLSFKYYNLAPQDSFGRVHLRVNLNDYADVEPGPYNDLGEYFYSFQYILDNAPGWNTVNIALTRGDSWGGGDFTYTGWAGDPGDGELDKDAIGGFALEFSVSGAGEGDVVTGTIILDDFKLTGSHNELSNGSFEIDDVNDDGFGWGAVNAGDGQAHTIIVENDTMAHTGSRYAELGVENGAAWGVFYTEDSLPAAQGETWEIGAYIKDISEVVTEGDFAGFKVESKDADGNIVESTGDQLMPITTEWDKYSVQFVMPPGTAQASGVLVVTRWDGSNCNYAFDDVYMVNLGSLDTEAPPPVENVNGIPATNYNLVTWDDVAGESGETYTVYASRFPITDITAVNVDVVASGVLEDTQAAIHYLYAPLSDESQDWYYAVSCTDAFQNVGEPGAAANATTNTALGVPTISLTPPTVFTPDGDLSEWADITPFEMGPTSNSYGTPHVIGTVDDDNDLYGTVYLAMDDEYFYIAAEAIDNVYDGYLGEGNWWEHDAFELFFGLYDQRGPRHSAFHRGDEPDYKLVFTDGTLVRDVDGQETLATNGDGSYYFEGFNPDYAFEARVSLSDIATAAGFEDALFSPQNGMRIIFEPTFHDRDGAGTWEGNVVMSPNNNDNAWQTPEVWSYTFIGDTDALNVDDPAAPAAFSLGNNYPNPFNPSTSINYSLSQGGELRLAVYNLLGQEVATLFQGRQAAGEHQIHFNAADLASGVYLYRLETANFTATKKMILMK